MSFCTSDRLGSRKLYFEANNEFGDLCFFEGALLTY